ncbi:MAG: cyclic nucleotide-binding domain-containing protein [Elusimicrobia bacterium]|nr:cyclic nucleotide-binding domain-containing protein [Elusimicrobiota bacterium]
MRLIKGFLKSYLLDPELIRRREALEKIPIFRSLTSNQLTRVLTMLYHRNYQEGEVIFKEGDIGRALFIIGSGKVGLYRKDKKGHEQELAVLEPGDFFGEMALLEEMPRSARAVAVEPSSLFFLYKSSLDGFIVQRPDIGASILSALAKLLSARLRNISSQIAKADLK